MQMRKQLQVCQWLDSDNVFMVAHELCLGLSVVVVVLEFVVDDNFHDGGFL